LLPSLPFQPMEALCSTSVGVPSFVAVRLLLSLGSSRPVQPFLVSTNRLCVALSNATQLVVPSCQGPGFRGWHIAPGTTAAFIVRGVASVDELLLRQPALIAALPEGHRVYIHTARVLQDADDAVRCRHASELADEAVLRPASSSSKRTAACGKVKVGPDDPRRVAYSPTTDLDGCFVTNVETNNCYNYACDILTNSVAQPGDGSGLCPSGHPGCIPSTCDDVRHAAISDGLIWIGTERPTALPSEGGHFVSLHMWEGESFHWLRMDNTTTWSQKDGYQPMKDTDNAGQPIVDPAAADLRPFTQHCGYMRVLPSNVTIL
jgi:hypothetical protein